MSLVGGVPSRNTPSVPEQPVTVVWFRRDLHVNVPPRSMRLHGVATWWPCGWWTRGSWAVATTARPRGSGFSRAAFLALGADLRAHGIPLVVRDGSPDRVVPEVAGEAFVDRVYVTDDVTPYSRRRDRRVQAAVAAVGARLERIGGPWRVPPTALEGLSGRGYLVATPFWRVWDTCAVEPRIDVP